MKCFLLLVLIASRLAVADDAQYSAFKKQILNQHMKLINQFNIKYKYYEPKEISKNATYDQKIQELVRIQKELRHTEKDINAKAQVLEKEKQALELKLAELKTNKKITSKEHEQLSLKLKDLNFEMEAFINYVNDKNEKLKEEKTIVFNTLEFAEYLKDLKLPGDCTLRIKPISGDKLDIHLAKGKTFWGWSKASLNFNIPEQDKNRNGAIAKYYGHEESPEVLITKFSNPSDEKYTEIEIQQLPNGKVLSFSMQSFGSSDKNKILCEDAEEISLQKSVNNSGRSLFKERSPEEKMLLGPSTGTTEK